jgi:hypothetical protein
MGSGQEQALSFQYSDQCNGEEVMAEVRITNAETGGEKGRKDERFGLLPWEQLREVARLYNFGSEKYQSHNWARGYEWSLSFDALLRHATQFWMGESRDQESGCSHMASVVFHALALMYFEQHHPELDDRMHVQLELFKTEGKK